jgi:quercetin dioxygenase-like cupin family protein
MKPIRLTNSVLLLPALALLSFAPVALSQQVTTTAMDGVPLSQEPDHNLILSNNYVNAYDVEVPPKGSTLLHQHPYDNIFVVFGPADVTNTVEGQTPAPLTLPDSSVVFGHAPYVHFVTNNGSTPFRNVTIELLQPQGQEKTFYKSVTDALARAVVNANFGKQNAVLETDAVRVLGVAIPVNGLWVAPSDGQPRLVVVLNDTSSPTRSQAKRPPSEAGTVVWYDGGGKDPGVANESDQPVRLMVLEFKQPQTQAKAQP